MIQTKNKNNKHLILMLKIITYNYSQKTRKKAVLHMFSQHSQYKIYSLHYFMFSLIWNFFIFLCYLYFTHHSNIFHRFIIQIREGAKYYYLTFVTYTTGIANIHLYCFFSSALKQYTTVATKYILVLNICLKKICPSDIMVFSSFPNIICEREQAAR